MVEGLHGPISLRVIQGGRNGHVLARQHSTGQGIVRHETNIFIVRRTCLRDSIFFTLSINQRKVALNGTGWCDTQCLGRPSTRGQAVGIVIAQSPTTNLSVLNQSLHGKDQVFKGRGSTHAPPICATLIVNIVHERLAPIRLRRVSLWPMQLIDIDVIRLQSFQASFAIRLYVFGIDVSFACVDEKEIQ